VPTLFVPMTGKSEDKREVLPDGSHPEMVNGGFELSTLQEGKADSWHYQRRCELVTEGAAEGKQYLKFSNDSPGRAAHILQGMPIDGRKVSQLMISLKAKAENLSRGPEDYDRPGFVIHFFDQRRLPIGVKSLGPWVDDWDEWEQVRGTIDVPKEAREAILQIGLNGATGTLSLDDMQMSGKE